MLRTQGQGYPNRVTPHALASDHSTRSEIKLFAIKLVCKGLEENSKKSSNSIQTEYQMPMRLAMPSALNSFAAIIHNKGR